jgi:ABC-type antimicrobial peptide transport system permease subunit
VVRSREPAAQLEPIRGAIRTIDENVAVFDLATADASIMAWAAPYRAAAVLTGSLGLLALTIATLGIYGVIGYIVSIRTREFGIRLALGARPGQVVRMVVDDAVHLVLIGLLAGVFITAVAERYLQSQRVRFMPNEISTWVGVLAAILVIGIAAAMVPARRAAATDPNVALREL